MAEEHKVKAVLNIGGEISSTLKGAFNLITGNIGQIGAAANKSIKGELKSAVVGALGEMTKLRAEMKRVGESEEMLGKIAAKQREIDRAKGSQQIYNNIGDATSKFAVGLAVVAAEATATGWAMFHLAEKTEEYNREIAKGASSNDMKPQNFARMKFMAGSDENLEALMRGRGIMSSKLHAQSKTTVKDLRELGITNLKEFEKLSRTDQMFAIGDKLKKFKGDKVAIMRDMFGRGGQDMAPVLMRGSEENKRRMKRADDLGLTPTDEEIAETKKYKAIMTDLGGAVLGVKLAFGNALMPAIERLGTTLTNFWIDHKDEFREWAKKLGDTINEHLPTMDQLNNAFKTLGKTIDFFADHGWACWTVLGAIVLLPFLPAIGAIAQLAVCMRTLGVACAADGMAVGAKGLLGICAANAPMLTMIGTIGLLTAGLVALIAVWNELHDKELTGNIFNADNWKTLGQQISGQFDTGDVKAGDVEEHRKIKSATPRPLARWINSDNEKGGYDANEAAEKAWDASILKRGKKTPNQGSPSASPSVPVKTATNNNTVTIHVHPSQGMDERSIAQLIANHPAIKALTGRSSMHDMAVYA